MKIHNLPPLTDDPAIDDVFPFDDASVSDPSSPNKTKKMTMAQMRTWVLAQFAIGNNLLLNGNMDVWQRNTSATPNDDTYCGADRWNFLAEANASWTVAQETASAPTGSNQAMKLSNATANNQCAIVQILEAKDAKPLFGQNVSFSFYAKTVSSEIANLRCAILSWSGTEDVVTSDVISAWGQNGTNPTWATSWTMENTPANLALTNSYQQFKIENVAIDTASMKNIAVVIWVDDGTITSGDDLWITQCMLNTGGTAAALQPRPYALELAMCQRYCYVKSTIGSNQTAVSKPGYAPNSAVAVCPAPASVPFRVTPSITATGSDWQIADAATAGIDATALAVSADPASSNDNVILGATVSGATQYRPYSIRGDGGGTRTYILDAEM